MIAQHGTKPAGSAFPPPALFAYWTTAATPEEEMKQPNFPQGWDEERVRRVLEHYEKQSDEEAVAEHEAACQSTTHTAMEIPVDLVPQVRELLAKRRAG